MGTRHVRSRKDGTRKERRDKSTPRTPAWEVVPGIAPSPFPPSPRRPLFTWAGGWRRRRRRGRAGGRGEAAGGRAGAAALAPAVSRLEPQAEAAGAGAGPGRPPRRPGMEYFMVPAQKVPSLQHFRKSEKEVIGGLCRWGRGGDAGGGGGSPAWGGKS